MMSIDAFHLPFYPYDFDHMIYDLLMILLMTHLMINDL